jgi:hypothetical protein
MIIKYIFHFPPCPVPACASRLLAVHDACLAGLWESGVAAIAGPPRSAHAVPARQGTGAIRGSSLATSTCWLAQCGGGYNIHCKVHGRAPAWCGTPHVQPSRLRHPPHWLGQHGGLSRHRRGWGQGQRGVSCSGQGQGQGQGLESTVAGWLQRVRAKARVGVSCSGSVAVGKGGGKGQGKGGGRLQWVGCSG